MSERLQRKRRPKKRCLWGLRIFPKQQFFRIIFFGIFFLKFSFRTGISIKLTPLLSYFETKAAIRKDLCFFFSQENTKSAIPRTQKTKKYIWYSLSKNARTIYSFIPAPGCTMRRLGSMPYILVHSTRTYYN
jgi:hypothetical protein